MLRLEHSLEVYIGNGRRELVATTGEEMRNGHYQAEWVRGMFQDFLNYDSNPYLHPLKGGVWFNCNDYAGEQTTNFLRLDPALTETLDAFRWGFKEMYKN